MSVKIKPRVLVPHVARLLCLAVAFAAAVTSGSAKDAVTEGGVIQVESAYGFEETVARLKSEVSGLGIRLFETVDQTALATGAGMPVHPSRLIVFGNPALVGKFVAAAPTAGLDWPVRMLVYQDASGRVWAAYSDFAYIARRHGIDPADPAFRTATAVVATITASIRAP